MTQSFIRLVLLGDSCWSRVTMPSCDAHVCYYSVVWTGFLTNAAYLAIAFSEGGYVFSPAKMFRGKLKVSKDATPKHSQVPRPDVLFQFACAVRWCYR